MNDSDLKRLPFDIRPLSPATLADLDENLFVRFYLPSSIADDILEQNHRSIAQQYASMRFTSVEPQSIPTTLGLLIVGKDPRDFVPFKAGRRSHRFAYESCTRCTSRL